MSRKALRMNCFGECILDEYDLFEYRFTTVHQKYPANPKNNPDVYQAHFEWSWNSYSGYGELDFYRSNMRVCNTFGENSSNMTVTSYSKKQQPNGRSNCALYNDPSLEGLFYRMLPSLDLSNAMLHDDYIEYISK